MKNTKFNIPMLAALILLLLTMVSTHFTAGLYARYTSYSSGQDSARVAKFAVQSEITENEDGTHTLTVINSSEVAVRFRVLVEMDAHLQATVEDETKTMPDGANSVTFAKDGWKLAPGESTQLTIIFAISDWSGITDPNSASGEMEQVELHYAVKVIAEQVD